MRCRCCRYCGKRTYLWYLVGCGLLISTVTWTFSVVFTKWEYQQRLKKAQGSWAGDTYHGTFNQRAGRYGPAYRTSGYGLDPYKHAASEQRHIGFLKVHKASSTVVQSIFLRFGWHRNLTFVLPPEFNPFRYPNIISVNESITAYNILPPPANTAFDILCNHVIYNHRAWSATLPNDTVYIGTVREPYRQFKSTIRYFRPGYLLGVPLHLFLQQPMVFEPPDVGYSFTNNRMAFEYGVPVGVLKRRDLTAFEDHLAHLDRTFKIVLVTERLDESLVLMKRYLHWQLKDILYPPQITRPGRAKIFYWEEEKRLYERHAVLDFRLYEFFTDRLESQIAAEDASFPAEVAQFKKIQDLVKRFCTSINYFVEDLVITIQESGWNESFNFTSEECRLLLKNEIVFTQDIRRRQYGVEPKWHF